MHSLFINNFVYGIYIIMHVYSIYVTGTARVKNSGVYFGYCSWSLNLISD